MRGWCRRCWATWRPRGAGRCCVLCAGARPGARGTPPTPSTCCVTCPTWAASRWATCDRHEPCPPARVDADGSCGAATRPRRPTCTMRGAADLERTRIKSFCLLKFSMHVNTGMHVNIDRKGRVGGGRRRCEARPTSCAVFHGSESPAPRLWPCAGASARAVMPARAHGRMGAACVPLCGVVWCGGGNKGRKRPHCVYRRRAEPRMCGFAASTRCCAAGVWQRLPGTPRGRAWRHRRARLWRLHRALQAPPRRGARGALTQPWLSANSFVVMSENWLIDLFRACFGSAFCALKGGAWAWGRGTATSKT